MIWYIATYLEKYIRCSAVKLLCNSLCGPRTKMFGDPCFIGFKMSLVGGATRYGHCTGRVALSFRSPRFGRKLLV